MYVKACLAHQLYASCVESQGGYIALIRHSKVLSAVPKNTLKIMRALETVFHHSSRPIIRLRMIDDYHQPCLCAHKGKMKTHMNLYA